MNEPWGLVVNEAMNAARPVIVSDQVGCAPDLIRQGQNGFVFRAGDVAALREALVKVLEYRALTQLGSSSFYIINKWGLEEDLVGAYKALDTCV